MAAAGTGAGRAASVSFSRVSLLAARYHTALRQSRSPRDLAEVLPFQLTHRCLSARPPHEKKDLYSILNISPNATQAQIKDVYYKLSKRFHPDRNKGSVEAHTRFQEITEAYSILGQYETRKKYDKGLLHGYTPPPHAKHFRQSTQAQTGKKKAIYDFDEFYRAHYGEALKREQRARQNKAEKKKREVRALDDIHQQLMIATVTVMVFVMGWYVYNRRERNKESS